MPDEDLLWNAPQAPPRQPKPGERLFEFVRASDRAPASCELWFNCESHGWEAQIIERGELLYNHDGFVTRALAVQCSARGNALLQLSKPVEHDLNLRDRRLIDEQRLIGDADEAAVGQDVIGSRPPDTGSDRVEEAGRLDGTSDDTKAGARRDGSAHETDPAVHRA
jgi:hypothetical protein